MADEVGGNGLDDINAGGQVREDTNKVTEEAVRRVQDNQKKAQQVGQDIKKDKATNDKFAQFLTFLLKEIRNDDLIRQVYQVFFKTRNTEADLAHIKKHTDIMVVVGMFVPFYQAEIKHLGLESFYQDIFVFDHDVQLTGYITYIKHLLTRNHDNIALDAHGFTRLLVHIAEYYHLTEKLPPEKALEFEHTLQKELSLNGF